MPPTTVPPTRQTSEFDLDRFNDTLRQQPYVQQWLTARGKMDTGRGIQLSEPEREQFTQMLRRNGVIVPSGMKVDGAGNFNQSNRLWRNIGIAAAIAGLAVTGLGAAGIGPLAGALAGGAGAAGAGGAAGAAGAGGAGAAGAGAAGTVGAGTAAGLGGAGAAGLGGASTAGLFAPAGLVGTGAGAGAAGLGGAAGAGLGSASTAGLFAPAGLVGTGAGAAGAGGAAAGLGGASTAGLFAPSGGLVGTAGAGTTGASAAGGAGGLGSILRNPDVLNAAGQGLGAWSQARAQNRGVEFGGQYDLERLLLERDQEERAGTQDAWRQLLAAQRTLSPRVQPNVSPYAVAPRQATDVERQAAEALSTSSLGRLQGGPRPLNVDPRLLRPGGAEQTLGWLSPVLTGIGAYYGRR